MTAEFAHAVSVCEEVLFTPAGPGGTPWGRLFEPFDFFGAFKNFLQVGGGGVEARGLRADQAKALATPGWGRQPHRRGRRAQHAAPGTHTAAPSPSRPPLPRWR
jgi:hypothetical protein